MLEKPMIEHDWDHFDELVQALAARTSDHAGLNDVKLATKLVKLFDDAQNKKLSFDYMTAITASEVSAREQICRKMAWLLQHALKAKVWCVNSRLLSVKSGKRYSPVIEQLKQIGIRSVANRVEAFDALARTQGSKIQTTVDSVLLSPDFSKLYVVKGCTISSITGSVGNRHGGQAVRTGVGTLWQAPDRVISDPIVDSDACRTLVLAWGVLKDTFNQLEVIPVYCVIDDFDGGWHFQAHDLSIPFWKQFEAPRTSLSSYPILTQSLEFLPQLTADPDAFNSLPDWASGTPFYHIPPDRPARSLMILDVLQREQAGNPLEIVPLREGFIAEQISERYDLFYTKDMRRHDLLHIQRRGLIQKHPGNSFSITALGLARFHVAVAMALGAIHPDFSQKILSRITRHAELTWKLRGL
jgi:hypothetical protein